MPGLTLDIGEGQIANAIAVALAESFTGEKRDSLLRDIIRGYLSHKENSYDKETLLSKRVGHMVREMAKEMLEQRVLQLKPRIQEIVDQQLGPGFAEEIIVQLSNGLATRKVEGIRVSIKMEEEHD